MFKIKLAWPDVFCNFLSISKDKIYQIVSHISVGWGHILSNRCPKCQRAFKNDQRGRKTHEKDVLVGEGQEYMTLFSFDGTGNMISKTDKEGNITTYQYDSLNRLTNVTHETSPTNQTSPTNSTNYVYDGRDNLIELTDAENNTTWFEYDRNNWLVKEIRPMTEETTYEEWGTLLIICTISRGG